MVGEVVSVDVELRGDCRPFQVERDVEKAWKRVPIFCNLTVPPFSARIEARSLAAREGEISEPG